MKYKQLGAGSFIVKGGIITQRSGNRFTRIYVITLW